MIWGTGKAACYYYALFSKMDAYNENKIVCFIDSDYKKRGEKFKGYPIISPKDIEQFKYDYISIWVIEYEKEIIKQITDELKIDKNKIGDIFMPYKQLLRENYIASNDHEIQELLEKIDRRNRINVYYYEYKNKQKDWYEAFYDANADLHYIFFEGKRMYLKRSFKLIEKKDGRKYIGNVWGEQDPNSPHLYEEGDVIVETDDILVDAGACEGNFSLHNIDKVKKIYLIECDEEWMEALHYTFRPYKNKVIFCDKFLSNIDTNKTVTLDTLISGQVDFIKMDIEGEEINALNGASNILGQNTNIKCSICSYHRHGDEDKIKQILNRHGLDCRTSKGYMLFIHDETVLKNPELRRGIVRGCKKI